MATDQQIRELLEKMHEERARLVASFAGVGDGRASLASPDKHGEDGWSIKEVLAHVAALDRTYRGWVYRAVTEDIPDLATPDPNVPPMEEHGLDGANERSILALLQEMERERATTMKLIADLEPGGFDRTAITANFGELSAIQFLCFAYRHDHQHADQIEGRGSDDKPRFVSGVEPERWRT